MYHWIESDDVDIEMPLDASHYDFEALEQAGFLMKVDKLTNPDDDLDTIVTYEITRLKTPN